MRCMLQTQISMPFVNRPASTTPSGVDDGQAAGAIVSMVLDNCIVGPIIRSLCF